MQEVLVIEIWHLKFIWNLAIWNLECAACCAIVLQVKSLFFWQEIFKHQDTKKTQRAQRKTKIIISFYLRDLSVHFVTLC